MIVLGLVLLVLAAVLGVGIVISNPAVLDLNVFGAHVPVTMAGLFFTGAVTMLVVVLALLLIQRGIARSRRRRRERKSLPPASRPAPIPAAPILTAPNSAAPTQTAPSPAATPAKARSAGPAEHDGPLGVPRSEDSEDTGGSTSIERAALLAEADRLSGEDPPR